MEEKDMREILERLDKSNRQQVRYARLQSILAVLAALCFIVCDRAFGILRQNYLRVWRSKLTGSK